MQVVGDVVDVAGYVLGPSSANALATWPLACAPIGIHATRIQVDPGGTV